MSWVHPALDVRALSRVHAPVHPSVTWGRVRACGGATPSQRLRLRRRSEVLIARVEGRGGGRDGTGASGDRTGCVAGSQGAALLPPCRAAEKQARGGHRKAAVPERPVAPEQLSDKWPVSKEGSKQVRTGGRQEGGPAGAAPSGGLCLRVPPRGSAGPALSALPASAAWAGQTGPWGVPQDATCAPRPTPAGAQRG